jgi:glucosamine 6-phosphate synthetase-like amidotransferase/phosphosugar isomerase protein
MCGICGFVVDNAVGFKNLTGRDVADDLSNLLKKLMVESRSRGTHASGVASVSRELEVGLLKKDVSSDLFIRDRKFEEFCGKFLDEKTRTVIGHTRHETKGNNKNNYNNHPIFSGRVIGIHNGHINNDEDLWTKTGFKKERQGKVDSEVIFHLIDIFAQKNGFKIGNAIHSVSKQLEGSYACAVVHLQKPKYLWLFNRTSPIYLYSCKEVGLKVFASNDDFIKKALESINLAVVEERMAKLPSNAGVRIDANSGKVNPISLHVNVSCDYGNI